MARKRMVSPGLLVSEQVAGMSIRARFGFVALLMYLDDRGRGKDNPSAIRSHSWPLDDSVTTRKMAADLDEMADAGLICRYTIEGLTYLHSPTWKSHQSISRPTESKLPPCPLHESSLSNHGVFTEGSGAIEVKRSEVEEKSSQGETRERPAAASRAAKLTQLYRRRNPLADAYRTQQIIAQALGPGGYADDHVAAALERLAADSRPLTENTLYVELNGQRKTSTTDNRVAQTLALAEELAVPLIPTQRAIGGSS